MLNVGVRVNRHGQAAAPAIGNDQPYAETTPRLQVLAAINKHRAIELANADSVAADLHGKVAGGFHTDGFEAEIFESRFADLVQQPLHGLRSGGSIVLRHHENAILREERGNLVVVAGVE